jgi:nucleoid-associated protein YgaU
MAQYTVKKGDTLLSIALAHYNVADSDAVAKIFNANKAVKGVGPTANDLRYETEPYGKDGKGQPVVLTIPD